MGHDAIVTAADDAPCARCPTCQRLLPRRLPTAPQLTTRQLQVIEMVAVGLSNTQIARRLKISKSAIKFHLDKAMGTLNATNRAECAASAIRLGLL